MERRDSHPIVASIKKYFRWGYDLCTRSVRAGSVAQSNLSKNKDRVGSRALLSRTINPQNDHSYGVAHTQVKLQHDLERFDCVMRLLVGNLSSDGTSFLMGDYATYTKVIYSFFKDTAKTKLDADDYTQYGIEEVARLVLEELTSLFQKNKLLIDAINKRFVHMLVTFKSWLTALDAQYPSDRRHIALTLVKILNAHAKLFETFRFRDELIEHLKRLTQSTTADASQGSEIAEALGLEPFDYSVEPLLDQCSLYVGELYQGREAIDEGKAKALKFAVEAIRKQLMDPSERSSVCEWIAAYSANLEQVRLLNWAVSPMEDAVVSEIAREIQTAVMEYVLAFSSKAAAARSRKDEDYYVCLLMVIAILMLNLERSEGD